MGFFAIFLNLSTSMYHAFSVLHMFDILNDSFVSCQKKHLSKISEKVVIYHLRHAFDIISINIDVGSCLKVTGFARVIVCALGHLIGTARHQLQA